MKDVTLSPLTLATLFENSVKRSRTESYSEIATFYLKYKI